jgi:F0F1-type ATP synthase epsilon subunit
MADTFELEIATPERSLVRETVVRAQIPGKDGYLGILPDHAALVSELGIGTLSYATAEGGPTWLRCMAVLWKWWTITFECWRISPNRE